MGNQTFCNCNKANESDELNTESKEKKVKSINGFIAQKVEEWSLSGREYVENSCEKAPRQSLLENKILNEKLNEYYGKVEGLNSSPPAINEKNFTFKTEEFEGAYRTEEEEQPCDYEINPCKEINYIQSKYLADINDAIDYEEDTPYIYNKPRLSDKKSSLVNESLLQLEKIDCNLAKNKKKEINQKIDEKEKNVVIENKNGFDMKDKIYNKKKHFNRSGEAVYYKTYDDKATESINQIHLNNNNNDNFSQFNTTVANNEKMIEQINENFTMNAQTNNLNHTKNINNNFSSELSSYLNFQNNLNTMTDTVKQNNNNSHKINCSNDKIVHTDPIYIENESKFELENNYDSIDNISLSNNKIDKSEEKESIPAEKDRLDTTRQYRLSKNILSVIPENILLLSHENDVIFLSELQRMINKQVTSHTTTLYSSRICVISKSEFKYYKSKESYLRMQKPLRTIPISSIIEVDFVKASKKRKTLDHFYLKLEEENQGNLSKISEITDMNKICLDKFDHSHNHIETVTTHRKIKLANQKKDNHPIHNTTSNFKNNISEHFIENYENQEKILIFSSEKEELVKKWVTILNYFIN